MELYLVQHGEASPETEDPERPLTSGIIHFQMAGIVCLSRQNGNWAVHWVMPPELLDRKDRP
jgi:phosphohistidine phosphatase SixA